MLLNKYKINDNRDYQSFKKVSISNYKINDLIKLYSNYLINSKIDFTSNLLIELHCSGHLQKIINTFIKIYFQNINIKNPYLFNYLMKKIDYLNKLLNNYKKKDYIHTRNDLEIRNLLIYLNGIITNSTKSNILLNKYLPKIKDSDYEETIIKNNIQSNNFDYLELIDYTHHENNYMKIACNEIFYLLYYKNNLQKIYFWYFWAIKHCDNDIFYNYLFKIIKFKIDTLEKRNKNYILLLILNFNNKLFNKSIKQNILFIIFYTFLNNVNFYKNIINKEESVLEMSVKVNCFYQEINNKINPSYRINNFFENENKDNTIEYKNIDKTKNNVKEKKNNIEPVNKLKKREKYKLDIYNKLFL